AVSDVRGEQPAIDPGSRSSGGRGRWSGSPFASTSKCHTNGDRSTTTGFGVNRERAADSMRAQAHILEPERVELANVEAEAPAVVTNLKNQAPLLLRESDLDQFGGCMLDGIVDGLLHDPVKLHLILLFVDVRTILVRELYTHAGKGVDTFDKEVECFGKALLLEYAGHEPAVDLSEAVGRLFGEAGDLFDLVLQAVRLQRIALHDIAAEKAHPGQ